MNDPFADLMCLLNGQAEKPTRHEPFPLTDIQHAYLIGRRRGFELGGVSSHTYLEFDCPALDITRLTAALREVIDRHDMLRAVVDQAEQHVLEHVPPYEIAITDVRGRSAAEQEAALAQVRGELEDQVLPTDQWPLFDIRATALDDRVRLHVSMDLLFVDLRGLFTVLDEWRCRYDGVDLLPATQSFRDYVLREPDVEPAQQYWLSHVDGMPAAPDLPIAVAPERLGRPSFVRLTKKVGEGRWAALKAVARRHALTPDALLLAAYGEVLRAWSRRQEFTITRTVLDRGPQAVGNFVSASLFAYAPSGTFAERTAAVQDRLRADDEHAAFTGIELLRELTRRQGDGRVVSMPVVYSSAVGIAAPREFGTLVHSASQTPQIWLENQVVESGTGVVLNWNAVDGLFPDGVLDEMFLAYQAVLGRLVDDETAWAQVENLVALPAEQARERDVANATDLDLPAARLHELVAEAARRSPDAVAVICDGTETTFGQLTEDAHRLARRLRELGAEPNAIIAVSMRPGPQLFTTLLGILHSGAAYVSIDPDLPEQRRHTLLRRCQAKALVTSPELREELDIPVVTLDEIRSYSPDPLTSVQGVDDLAYVIFTSGSTGEPKGVMISHRSAANTVQDINQRFDVCANDRVLALAPTGFDLSVYDVFGVLGAGGAIVVPTVGRAHDPAHWTDLIDRHGVTVWNSVPAPMRLWVESLDDAGPVSGVSVRLALLSGDWIPTTLPGQIRDRFPTMDVISLGGATEASIWSIFYPIGEVSREWASIPYGKPLANQTMHVYNERFEPCPIWATGEIYIGGIGVAIGYWNDPVRTQERFVVHPVTGERLYRTGDLGRYLPGGDIEILGRTDFQVKINGYRVELGEIEAALSRQPGVRQALVAAPAHPQTGQRQLAAYIVGAIDPVAVRAAVAKLLPSYMVPSHYVTVRALPLTTNGKIDHAALPAPWHDEPECRVSPRDDIERRLLKIWAEQLGHNDLGVEDGFFDVGGDSLHAVGIVGHLRTEFDIDSSAEQDVIEGLFTNATIAEFAEVIRSVAGSRV